MKLPYDDSVVQDWFTKDKDFIIWVKGKGDPIMAGLFLPYRDAPQYIWMENHSGNEIDHSDITHYMVIPD